jgi:DNA invertase Pin-like site-specific DNA recombinase
MRNDQVETVHPPIVDIASGKSLQRSGLEELQKLVKSRSIDYLYISDLSRLGRSHQNPAITKESLRG